MLWLAAWQNPKRGEESYTKGTQGEVFLLGEGRQGPWVNKTADVPSVASIVFLTVLEISFD